MSRHPVTRAPVALVVAITATLALAVPAAAQVPVSRLDPGVGTVASAVAWSQVSFADGAAPAVLIARDDDFADALATGAVQGALDAPLLLTDPTALSPATAQELTRLDARQAYVMGGADAIGDAVVTELEGMGLDVERVFGATRIETAIAVQQRFFPDATAVVLARAFGTATDPTQGWADTINVGAYSAATDIPVLLTDTDRLSTETAAQLTASAVQEVIVVGGPAAVSEAAASAAGAAIADGAAEEVDPVVRRLGGDSRFDTAVAVAMDLGYATAADAPRVLLAEGQADDAWASGLPGGAQAGNGAAMVVASGDQLLPSTLAFLSGGGVPLVCAPGVSPTACDAAAAALDGAS